MHQRLLRLLLLSLVAMLAIVPAASARSHHGWGHHGRGVCGTLASVAADGSSLVITTKHRGDVTVTNPNAVVIDPTLLNTSVCAKVTKQVATDGTKTLVLVSLAAKPVHVKPYAKAIAVGPMTDNGDGTVTVATITFIVPTGMTLPASGDLVVAAGKEATAADTQFTLKWIRARPAMGNHHAFRHGMGRGWRHGNWLSGDPHAAVSGPVTAFTAPPDASTDGSITVATVAFVIPAAMTLPTTPNLGDKFKAQGVVTNGVLTLTPGCNRGRHHHHH